jgi:hypothetical protein
MNKQNKYNKWVCVYCQRSIGWNTDLLPTKDHFYPVAKHGRDCDANKLDCCTHCNAWKANLSPEQFISRIEFAISSGERVKGVPRSLFHTILTNAKGALNKLAPIKHDLIKRHTRSIQYPQKIPANISTAVEPFDREKLKLRILSEPENNFHVA